MILLFIAYASYVGILFAQKAYLGTLTLKLSVLSTRTALFLPIYATIMWLSLVVPDIYLALQIPTALFEGYSFYCFFAMIVFNLGGPQGCVDVMRHLKTTPVCNTVCSCNCCPEDAGFFYLRVNSALFHLQTTRCVIVFISVICSYVGLKAPATVLAFISLFFVANGFLSLVNFYYYVYSVSGNLLGNLKISLLKLSVVLIVLQGLILELLLAFGNPHAHSDCNFSPDQQAQRIYCLIVLIEFAILSALIYYAYAREIKPNESVVLGQNAGGSTIHEPIFIGHCDFLCKILNL